MEFLYWLAPTMVRFTGILFLVALAGLIILTLRDRLRANT